MVEYTYEGLVKYITSKAGEGASFSPPINVSEAHVAAQRLSGEYDLGIELANDGLTLGYIFHLHGFPTKAVKLGRKGRGAVWQPLEDLKERDIKDKRLLLMDIDVVTGRTLKRAVHELGKYSPQLMDLLLVHENTILNVKTYKNWRRIYNLPSPQEVWSHLDVVGYRETPVGLQLDFRQEGNWIDTLEYGNSQIVSMNVRRNVPPQIRKTMTLSKDFKGLPGDVSKLVGVLEGQ